MSTLSTTRAHADASPRDVQIEVNGASRTVSRGTSVSALLATLGLAGRRVAVARNGCVVPRSAHASQPLENGDRFEILEAVGGG